MKTSPTGASPAPTALSGRDLLAAFVVVLIFGSNFVAMKHALHEFTAFQLGAARYAFAALPLALFIRRPQMPWRWLLWYGLSQGLCQFGFLFLALQIGMTAALASVLMQTQVFFTTLLGAVLLHERIGGALRAGLALATLGLGCFAMNFVAGDAAPGSVTVLGLVLNLCSAASWAVANIITRKAQQSHPSYDPFQFVVWASLVPVLPFMGLSLLFDAPAARWHWLHASGTTWASAAYLGWVSTVLAYALWTGLFKRHPANRVAPFSLGVPVLGMAAGILLLGEHVTAWQWAGTACVVTALAVVMTGERVMRWFGTAPD